MSETPDGPWQKLSGDFYGPLRNGSYLLVLLDDGSKFPIVRKVSSTAWNKVIPILNSVFCEYGIPKKLRTDNGPPFNSYKFSEFSKELGFFHQKVTPKWAQANGQVESFMRNLGKVVRSSHADMASFEAELNEFLRNYRSTPHASTQIEPSRLLFQGSARATKLPSNEVVKPTSTQLLAQANDSRARAKMKQYNDEHRHATESTLKVGDMVLLKRDRRLKSDTIFDPIPYTIAAMKGSMCTIKRDDQELARNASLLKL